MLPVNKNVILNSVLKDYIENLASSVPTYKGGQQAIDKFGLQNIQKGVPQGLNFGLSEISDFQNQYNNGAGRNNPINIPKTPEEVELAKLNKFNNVIENSPQNGGITEENHLPELNKFKQALLDLRQGYLENRDNAFKPENWDGNNQKSIWNRIGEIGGTTARLAKNPMVQGAATGILTGALTGSPMFGLTNGFNLATAKQNSDMYKKQLAENGVNVDTGIAGMLNDKNFNSLLTPKYKETENNTALARIAEQEQYHNGLNDFKQQQLEQEKKYQDALLEIKRQQAENEKIYKEFMAKIAQQNADTNAKKASNKQSSNKQTQKSSNAKKELPVSARNYINKYIENNPGVNREDVVEAYRRGLI